MKSEINHLEPKQKVPRAHGKQVFSLCQNFIIFIFVYFSIVSIGHAANIEIPAFSGEIQSPKDFTFNNYYLKFYWFCNEDTLTPGPISFSSTKSCGGFGQKSGTQIVDISKDGIFKVSPVSSKRYSLIRNPKFYIRFGLIQNNTIDMNTDDNEYSKRYVTGQNYDVSEQLLNDLSQLRVIRVRGGKFKVKISARDSNGDIDHFNSLMKEYPKSSSLESKVFLLLKGSESEPECKIISLNVINSQFEIPDIDFFQVGGNNKIFLDVSIRASIRLVKRDGSVKVYFEEKRLENLHITVNENHEASFKQNYFEDIDLTVAIQ